MRATIRGRRSKYGAVRTTVDGVTFASKAEARRYGELKLLEKAGQIRNICLQPRFELHAWPWDFARRSAVLLDRDDPLTVGEYVADFSYEYCPGGLRWSRVVEDVKGMDTPLSRWKRKHVKAQYGVDVQIVT